MMKYLDDTGLSYFWGKLKAFFAPKAHTHNAFETKHSYTVAVNAAKNWYRIANANTSQLDTTKPIRAQFIVTAYNTSYAADYYETWFVNAIVFGRTAHISIFGGSNVPFNQARILYENTVADIDANDRPAIDLYLNYVLPNGTTKIEVEEIYNNGGWTFVADGQLVASSVPSGFESISCGVRNNGVDRSITADYATYLNRQISNITAAFTLTDNYLYRSRTLNCTGTFTITIPSINSGYMWCVIKNKNTSSGVITLHPSTTSVLIDGSNADITLQPMEYVCIHSAGANNYSLIADGRWKSQKADKATTLAGYGITDAKIANGTITLGSNSITPLTSVPSHNQASNTITAMTGYSKPSSGSAIAASDSLNQAVGKLEAKVDSVDRLFVHVTGDEYISGYKLFDNLRIRNGSLDYTSKTGTDNDNEYIAFYDTNNLTYSAIQASVRSDLNRLGFRVMQLNNFSGEASNVPFMGLQCTANHPNGYGVCPNMDDLSNDDNVIATTYWVRHATGNTTLNAATATKLSTARNLATKLDSTTAVTFDGSGNQNAIPVTGVLPIANGGTGSSTQNFVDLSSNQSITGLKTLYGIKGSNLPDFGANDNHSFFARMLAQRDTVDKSCSYFRRYRQNKAQGVSSTSDFYIGTQENETWATNLDFNTTYTVDSSAIDVSIALFPVINVSRLNGETVTKTSTLGTASSAWDNLYSVTGPWAGSDARLKDGIEDLPLPLMRAWEKVGFKIFQMKDAKARKGEGARLHVGVVAQDVAKAFASEGLDAGRYGLYGYDKWDAKYEDGSLVQDAGDKYSIRYEEALALECACQRRLNKKLGAEIEALKARVATLEEKLNG